jgi:hypothetical protein
MMPETIPDIRADKGFQKDAEIYATGILNNKRIRVDDFYLTLKNLIVSAYLQGGQVGFNTGWRIKEMEDRK